MVSIVIVTWNNEDLICNCINSILKFEEDLEIIVVDNNSTDKTVDRVTEMKLENVKAIGLNENLGFSKANNIGAELAKGNNILFLNPDTLFIEKELNRVFSYLNDNIGIVSCKFLNADGSTQPSCFNFDTPINIILEQFMLGKIMPPFLREILTPYLGKHNKHRIVDWTVGAFIAMKKDDFIRIGGFSEDYFLYSEDMDLCYKVNDITNKKTLFISSYQIIHLGGQSEKKDINSTKHKKLLDSKIVYAKKFSLNNNIKMLLLCYQIKHFIYHFASLMLPKGNFEAKLSKYSNAKKYLLNQF